jgi:mannose-6-phosphate isomerase-like protein (cupin superfamily)
LTCPPFFGTLPEENFSEKSEDAMDTVSRESAEHYIWGDVCDGWHLLKSKELSVIEERVPAGGAETKHYHKHAHQFFFVLSGSATMEIGNKRCTLLFHQGISVPPGVPHLLMNESDEELSFIVISAPMSHGDRVPVI